MTNFKKAIALAALAIFATGCSTVDHTRGSVQFPKTGNEQVVDTTGVFEKEQTHRYAMEPIKSPTISVQANYAQPSNGSIYAKSKFRSIYSDRTAKFVGDILTIRIQERLQSASQSNSSVSREDSASIETPSIKPIGSLRIPALSGSASSSKSFDGGGTTTARNQMSGTISATVLEVMPNGYLRVMGEKQLGTNRQVEVLRIYGLVDPYRIDPDNSVLSSQIADARIEYVGNGTIDKATQMGWLSEFFLSYLPF